MVGYFYTVKNSQARSYIPGQYSTWAFDPNKIEDLNRIVTVKEGLLETSVGGWGYGGPREDRCHSVKINALTERDDYQFWDHSDVRQKFLISVDSLPVISSNHLRMAQVWSIALIFRRGQLNKATKDLRPYLEYRPWSEDK